jgi:signal transduction histidine kinase
VGGGGDGRPPEGPRRFRIDLDVIENARIRGDREQLTQVFLNLGINAFEAMEARGGTLSISLKDGVSVRHAPTPRGGFRILEDVRVYEVAFEDTGCGIEATEVSKIFEPFFTTKPGGTGLGLAIAERIVKGHGGTITAESLPLSGAVLRVRLPSIEQPEGVVGPVVLASA